MSRIALLIEDVDNVATVLSEIKKSDIVVIKGQSKEFTIISNHEIPFGHKIAIKDIKKGEDIIKYGETIGVAITDIKEGDYVHIHNVDSKRGKVEGEKNE